MNGTWKRRFSWLAILSIGGMDSPAGASEDPPGFGTYVTDEVGTKAIDRFSATPDHWQGGSHPLPVSCNTPIAPLSSTFTLHSHPGATRVIYLDFDGHYGLEGGGIYYGPYNFEGPDSTFSPAELAEIQLAWQSVAEDFLPFDVDVTTEDPGTEALRKTSAGDIYYGIRVVVSPSNWDYSWAYVGSFNWDTDYEAQAWTGDNTWIWIADSASHEVGHAMWLGHDGGGGDGEYYEGHGSGATHWSPIMGWSGYGLSQWSIGEYAGANNTEDDLIIITTQNGFGYRPDDHGSTTGTATPIVLGSVGLELVDDGIIERTNDVDYFSFTMATAGNVQFEIGPDNLAANLDILAKIHDAGGSVLHTSNPSAALNASFGENLAAGNYFLSIDGFGLDDPLGPPADGYSDYGCLGYYSIQAYRDPATSVAGGVSGSGSALRFTRRPVSPFAISTSFSFALPRTQHVEAAVYDVRGRLVELLIDGDVVAGVHTVVWEPGAESTSGAGLYFLRIEGEEKRITARVVRIQ